MIEDKLKEILAIGLDPESILHDDCPSAIQKSGLTKEDVKDLADAGNLDAAIVLLIGETSHQMEFYTEPFEDENTHKVVEIERRRILEEFIFPSESEEREALAAKVATHIPLMDSQHLTMLRFLLHGEVPVSDYVKELAKRGDADALETLGNYYAEGYEAAGFAKDKEKAREFYKKALEAGLSQEWYDNDIEMLDYSPLEHPQDLADDFDPRNATIMISGHPLNLDQIENMVEDLTKAHGDPGNEVGLFVNLLFLFKTLGFDWVDNTGNLMHITRHNEADLTLDLECNPRVDEALVEAFQKAYPKLTVEVVAND